jgi:hypothetical protein
MKTMRTILFFVAALILAADGAVAQTNKNIPGPADYASFSKFVTDRNIFDPNRQPHFYGTGRTTTRRTTTRRVSSSAPAFTLVGTMSYGKGLFAFFNGNSPELKQALQASGSIAGYQVTEISQGSVRLESADKKEKLELKVGDVMRQENGRWQFSGAGEISGASSPVEAGGAAADAGSAPAVAPSANLQGNDILKRLMEQRAKENQ